MTTNILVIAGERNWTRRAVHLAGALARENLAAVETPTAVVIVWMEQVAHLEDLGSGWRETLLTYDEFDALAEYVSIVESYGVTVTVESFEYSDYVGGVLGAAETWPAAAVFAQAPASAFSPLARLRLWVLRRSSRQPLYTLGPGDGPLVKLKTPSELSAAMAAQPSVSVRHS